MYNGSINAFLSKWFHILEKRRNSSEGISVQTHGAARIGLFRLPGCLEHATIFILKHYEMNQILLTASH